MGKGHLSWIEHSNEDSEWEMVACDVDGPIRHMLALTLAAYQLASTEGLAF